MPKQRKIKILKLTNYEEADGVATFKKNEKNKKKTVLDALKSSFFFFRCCYCPICATKNVVQPPWSSYKAPSCLKFLSWEAESWTLWRKIPTKMGWMDLNGGFEERLTGVLSQKKSLGTYLREKKNATMYDVFLDMQVANPEWRFTPKRQKLKPLLPPGLRLNVKTTPLTTGMRLGFCWIIYVPWSKVAFVRGMVISPLIGILIMGI